MPEQHGSSRNIPEPRVNSVNQVCSWLWVEMSKPNFAKKWPLSEDKSHKLFQHFSSWQRTMIPLTLSISPCKLTRIKAENLAQTPQSSATKPFRIVAAWGAAATRSRSAWHLAAGCMACADGKCTDLPSCSSKSITALCTFGCFRGPSST